MSKVEEHHVPVDSEHETLAQQLQRLTALVPIHESDQLPLRAHVPVNSEREALGQQLQRLTALVQQMTTQTKNTLLTLEGATMQLQTLRRWVQEIDKRGGFVERFVGPCEGGRSEGERLGRERRRGETG
jgi:hypothetical protein